MTTTRRRRTSRAQRGVTVAELAAQMKEFADSLDPAERAAYETRFDHYSERNSLLIVMQAPAATVVHGFEDWKKHGRQVRKGETSHIWIRAPHDYKEFDPATGREVVKTGFHRAAVFEIEQTDPIEQMEGAQAA